ncbi:N-acetylmuramic acid 6-phosphate etherase [Mesorhizobium sp. WSM2239]|uniref:N-acetylmuramic acid 6-phosphate etherase n=2 Tax=unclassified Mesorhizobium TaxID=325217 RepID=A0AAU8D8F7_9HYPH
MAIARTEAVHRNASGLDLQPPEAIVRILADAQVEAAKSVRDAAEDIARAAGVAAHCLSTGGRLVYAAAGSSALMALADALELPGTFGISRDRIVILLAGGLASLSDLTGGPEDDAGQARREIAATGVSNKDCVIAVSASGSTPYAVGALEEARSRGAATISLANNAGAPLTALADVGIVIQTPPEVIAGSTRMGAGTAQKIALNMMSTLMAIHLGHVHDGYMVNLNPDNLKLKGRAGRIVAAISGCTETEAASWLDKSGGSVKAAILLAAGAASRDAAQELLASSGQKLRPALAKLEGSAGAVSASS